MYESQYSNRTIKQSQKELLRVIINNGKEIEDTIEVTNISVCIKEPLFNSEELTELITPIAKEHMSQMMLEPNPKLEKTHYERLHNWKERKYQSEYIKDFKGLNPIRDEIITLTYNQIDEVINRLKRNPFSKRCVLTLWQPQDVNDKYGLSWTFAQLFIRNNKLIMTNYFRSCDIYNAFPWNVLGIAKLQKEIADKLQINCGEFIVYIGSCHIYKIHKNKVNEYLA